MNQLDPVRVQRGQVILSVSVEIGCVHLLRIRHVDQAIRRAEGRVPVVTADPDPRAVDAATAEPVGEQDVTIAVLVDVHGDQVAGAARADLPRGRRAKVPAAVIEPHHEIVGRGRGVERPYEIEIRIAVEIVETWRHGAPRAGVILPRRERAVTVVPDQGQPASAGVCKARDHVQVTVAVDVARIHPPAERLEIPSARLEEGAIASVQMNAEGERVAIEHKRIEIPIRVGVRRRDLHRIVSAGVLEAGAERTPSERGGDHPAAVPGVGGEEIGPRIVRHVGDRDIDRSAKIAREDDVTAVAKGSISLVLQHADRAVVGIDLRARARAVDVEVTVAVDVAQLGIGEEITRPLLILGDIVDGRREGSVAHVQQDGELEAVARHDEIRAAIGIQVAGLEIRGADPDRDECGGEEAPQPVVAEDCDPGPLSGRAIPGDRGVGIAVAVEIRRDNLGRTRHRREGLPWGKGPAPKVAQQRDGASLIG